jgi:hypothetical protein
MKILLFLSFGFISPILGSIFSVIALNQIKKTGQRGQGLAIAGLVISIAFFLILLSYSLIALIAFGVTNPQTTVNAILGQIIR